MSGQLCATVQVYIIIPNNIRDNIYIYIYIYILLHIVGKLSALGSKKNYHTFCDAML